MPGTDGFELAKTIRELAPEILKLKDELMK